jgi:cellobiose-specific phosphotransferase system component IIA
VMNERLMMRDRLLFQASDSVAEAHQMLFQMLQNHAELEAAVDLLSQAMDLITEAYE